MKNINALRLGKAGQIKDRSCTTVSISLYLGGINMSGRNSIMSDKLKMEIAKELGIYDTVQSGGFGEVSSRNCGNMVKKAIEMAERNMSSK
jgi:small acid-soluble spore protein F (minor alpha/beta-type SASP)